MSDDDRTMPIPWRVAELPSAGIMMDRDADGAMYALVDSRITEHQLATLAQIVRRRIDLDGDDSAPEPGAGVMWLPAQHIEQAAGYVERISRGLRRQARNMHLVPSVGEHGGAVADPQVLPSSVLDATRLGVDRAQSARMYDYLLGGKDNYEADRIATEQMLKSFPHARTTAFQQRGLIHRTTRFVASLGIDQFIDVGTGIPTEPNLHQVAQQVNPAANVIYVDNNPIVLAHAAALMTSTTPGVLGYLEADARDPEMILASAEVEQVIDLGRPVGVSLIGLLHFLNDQEAVQLVRTLMDAVPPGSTLALSQLSDRDVPGYSDAIAGQIARGIPMWVRSKQRTLDLFTDGLDIIEPGLVYAADWRPEAGNELAKGDSARDIMFGMLARKP